jgi:hypothetical protein
MSWLESLKSTVKAAADVAARDLGEFLTTVQQVSSAGGDSGTMASMLPRLQRVVGGATRATDGTCTRVRCTTELRRQDTTHEEPCPFTSVPAPSCSCGATQDTATALQSSLAEDGGDTSSGVGSDTVALRASEPTTATEGQRDKDGASRGETASSAVVPSTPASGELSAAEAARLRLKRLAEEEEAELSWDRADVEDGKDGGNQGEGAQKGQETTNAAPAGEVRHEESVGDAGDIGAAGAGEAAASS